MYVVRIGLNGGGIIMMFCSDKERDFFNNWFFHAQQDSNYDPEKQFFYFYALFDHLFKSYTKEKKNVLEKQGLNIKKGEKYKMLFFLYSILFYEEEKEYFEDFNPFATLKSKNETYLLKKIKIIPVLIILNFINMKIREIKKIIPNQEFMQLKLAIWHFLKI